MRVKYQDIKLVNTVWLLHVLRHMSRYQSNTTRILYYHVNNIDGPIIPYALFTKLFIYLVKLIHFQLLLKYNMTE